MEYFFISSAKDISLHSSTKLFAFFALSYGKAATLLTEADPIRLMTVMSAFWPEEVRETMKDQLAAEGVTVDDLKRLIRELESKLESPYRER